MGKSEQDFGICLKVPCPHCQRESEFRLRLRSATLKLFGQPVASFGGCCELVCSLCQFQTDVEEGELPAAQTAVRLYAQLTAHEIDLTGYGKALDALDFATLHKLRDAAATWACPACQEKVPATLNGCWKCGSPRPGLQKADSPESDELPRLPYPIVRSPHPWEQ